MTAPLCNLIALSEMWGSNVLSNLTLLEVIRLDSALLNHDCRSGLLGSYRALPAIAFPLSSSTVSRELSWKWLFSRGFKSKRITFDKVYYESTNIQELIVEYTHAQTEGVKTPGFDHSGVLTFLSTTPPALLDKVRDFSLSSCETQASTSGLPNVRLPFHQLRHFGWRSPDIDHQCLISALEDNPLLEGLRVHVDAGLPPAFFPTLSLRRATLTSLSLDFDDLTDADMHEIGRNCPSLTDLDLSGLHATHVTDAGISALAESCVQLRKVTITYTTLTGDSLAALFTHCVHLHSVCFWYASINDAAVIALCDPKRVASLDKLECSWAASLQLAATFYQQAFSGIKRFCLLGAEHDSVSSLCFALRAMRQLDSFAASFSSHTTAAMHASILDAVAQGTSVLRYLSITFYVRVMAEAESALANIARNNPHLHKVWIVDVFGGVTGVLLHALAENCAYFSDVFVMDASLVTDASLCALACGCPRLSNVILMQCTSVTDSSVFALAGNCPLLAYLNVNSSVRISLPALEHLVRSCKKLNSLNVSGVSMTEEAALRLQSLMPGENPKINHGQVPAPAAPGWVQRQVASVRRALSRCWAVIVAIGHPVE
jgi:hypothetical protein